MKARLLFFAAVLGSALAAHATTNVTVNWKASDDNGFGLADGTPLAVGNEVRLGAFDFTGNISGSIQGYVNSRDFVGLASHFRSFDTAYIGTSAGADLGTVPLADRSGLFEKSSGTISLPTGSSIFNAQIFLWVFKTVGNNAVAGDFSNVLQMGVFSSNTSSWLFPGDSNNGIPGTTSIELTNLSNAAGDALLGTALIPVGSFGLSSIPLATGDNHVLRLMAVPEPTAALLAITVLLPLLACRRFRRSLNVPAHFFTSQVSKTA
jgi:hypothetical protein